MNVSPVTMDRQILKVAHDSKASRVAGAIAGALKQTGIAELQAINERAIHAAVRAVAIASKFPDLAELDPVCRVELDVVDLSGCLEQVVKLIVTPKSR
ncbi:MAG TPA: stage V sporulation protein S [Symbiobacteriaceae bacterium]|jgi:stage V sporulation protein S